VNMSKEVTLNSSSECHSHDKWNIEGDDVKLHEAISSLRALVSGETNAILCTYYSEITILFLTNKSNFICIYCW
jgi:hypothetical protein